MQDLFEIVLDFLGDFVFEALSDLCRSTPGKTHEGFSDTLPGPSKESPRDISG